jgi:DNA-binding transcriptional LysR family regulator
MSFMPQIDLNLLRVFEALYELRSVTRAAERLGRTQSAVSHSLGRLRQALGDPLFVRHPDGLQPTALATDIAPAVREGLEQLRLALFPVSFEPATALRRFRITTGVYFSALLVPELIARTRVEAPNVSLAFGAPGSDLLASLDSGTTDLALGAFGKVPPRLHRHLLFREELVWIARAGSPVATDPRKLATWPVAQRLSVAAGRPYPGHGAYSWENGLERLVLASGHTGDLDGIEADGATSVHDPLTAIATVAATDLIAVVPRRLALKSLGTQAIAIVDAPAVSEVDMAMLWHSRLSADYGLEWLRATIESCLDRETTTPSGLTR